MEKQRCPKCKSFISKQFVTHTGGNCKRCGAHVVPEWYAWGINNRPLGEGEPMAPWSFLVEIRPDQLDKLGLATVLNFHMGLELPSDTSKAYRPPFSNEMEPEMGPWDVSPENALHLAGMQGVDQLHNALLIVAGGIADVTGVERGNAVRAANLCYYMATQLYVGSGADQRELELEQEVREREFEYLQDAVFFVFDRLDLVHTASVEYITREHPSYLF
ncbi:MAG: hypothetical protein ABIG91_03570 [Patescibacteria group bacterium]